MHDFEIYIKYVPNYEIIILKKKMLCLMIDLVEAITNKMDQLKDEL